MRRYTRIFTTLIAIFSVHFAQAQCPIPASAVAFTASANNICAQTDITFTVTNPDANYIYTWDFDDASSSSNTATGTVVTHSFSPNSAGGSHNVTVTATPRPSTTQAATWKNVDQDLTASGNTLSRDDGSGSGWNAGAESNENIMDDMYMEFTAGPTSNRLMAGLGNGNVGNDHFNTIDYAVYTRYDGTLRIYENGSQQANVGSYAYGDTIRVGVENGVVKYYKNGTLLYTSSNAPTLPMFVDLSIRNQNDTLHNVNIGYSCTASNSTTITTLATPNIDVTGTWDRCIAVDNLGFTNTIFQINNHDPSQLYSWDFGDGTTLSSFADIQTHTYNNHGVYTVSVSATNGGGCTGTYTNQVLYLERPLADMVIVGTADICEGDTILVANNTDTTNIDFYVMDWGDGTRDTVYNTDTLSHVYNFSDVFVCTISQGGQPYTITLYAVNSCFEHTNSSPITVTATPRADFNAPTLVCEATNNLGGVNFSASICPPPADIFSDLNNYIWDFGDPASGALNTSTFSTPTHTFTSPGNYQVTVQLISNCGTFYDTMQVRVLDDPEAGYTFLVNNPPLNNINGDGCAPIEVQFTNTTTGDSVSYAWTIQTDVIGGVTFLNSTSDTSTNPEIRFSEPGSYIVTLTATNQCTATTFVDTITVLQGPNVTINPPSPTCDTFYFTPDVTYDAGGGAILTYDWSFPGGTPATSNVANPTNILYTSSGTYTATVTITNECTSISESVTFYVPLTPDPVTLSANGNQNTCVDAAAFTLSADSTGGTWSGTGITNSSLGTFNPAVAGVGTHTISYIYNPRVCPDTSTIDITVNALPTVDAAGDISMCLNDGTTNLTGATPAGGTWSGTGVSGNIFDPLVSGAGVFPVTYTYTDGNGCTNTDNREVRVYALPVLNVGADLVECNGPDDIPLNAAPAGGTWSGTGITPGTSNFNTQNAGGVGNYNVNYSYTDGNGCTNQATLNIDVITGTPVDAGNDTTQCVSGDPLELVNGTPTGGTWSGAGVFNNSGDYFFYPSVAGTGFHTLTYSLGSGSCEETDVMVINVIDVPTVDANSDTSVCVSSPSFEMTGYSPLGGTWSGAGITGTTFDPSTGVGTYPLVYSYTDPLTGCENSDTRQVVVNGLPTVTTSATVTECDNPSDIQLTGFSPGGGTWSGAGIVDASLGTFNTVTAGGLGYNNGDTIYNLTYVYTDGNGCIDSSQTAVTVTFGDVVDAGTDNTICINNGAFALVGFTPNDGTGTWSGTGVAGTNFFPAVAGLGPHTLTYTYGSGSCEKTDTKIITVIDIPSINAGNDTLVCEATGSFTLVPFHPAGGTWSGTGVSGNTFDPVVATPGSHTLTYSFTDAVTGCENTDTKVITVAGLPSVLTNGMDMYCIDPDNITLTNYSPGGGVWTGDGIVDANNGIFNGTTAGGLGYNNADTTYPVTYTYTDGNGCSNSDVLTITITAGVDVEAGPLDTVCEYDAAFIINGFSPSGGIWSGTGISNANTGQFNPGSVAPGDYEVTYTFGSGTCERSDKTIITVGATPVVNAGADTSICEATGSFTLWNYSPAGGTWTSASAGLSGTTFDPVAAGVGTHILTYTYIDPFTRCENFDTKNITVTALPNVITTGPIQECISPDNITLTGYSPITGAGGTGVWTGTGIVDAANGIFNGTTAGGTGVYNLTYTYTDNNGCIDSSIMQVTVVDSVTVEAGPLDTVCQYDAPFTINGFTPAGGIWQGTGISNANTGQYDPGSVAPGTYEVIYTIGSGTCERSDTTSILIVPTPTVEAGSNIEICADSAAFTLTGFSPAGGIWSGTGITDSVNGVFDPQVAGDGVFTITYTYAEPINGCENSDTRTIRINALPVINMPDTMMYCNSGGDITLSGYTPTGGIWQGNGITDANNGVFNTVVAGGIGFNNADTTYPVLYIYTDNNGCIDSADLNVTLVFGDTIDAGPDFAVCVTDDPDTLTGFIPTSGGTWSGPGIINASLGIFDPASAGAGTWTLTYTHGIGTCLKTDTREVLVGAVPTVLAGNDLDYCISDAQDTLTGFSPANGIWSGTGITDTVNGYFDPATAGAGSYLVTYTFTHPITGCVNADNRILDVNPLPVVDAGDTVTYCFNQNNVTLSNYSPLGGTWSGVGIVDATNGIFNSVNAGGLGYNNADTTYPVVYTVTSGDGCIDNDTLTIIIEFGDTVDAGGPFGVCIDDGLVTLSTLTPAFTPSTGGTWTGPGIVDGANGIFDPTAVVSNTAHTLVYTFGTGTCQKTDSTTIFVGTIPFVEAGDNDTICSADPPLTLSGFVPNNGGTWSGTGITDASGIFDPSVSGAGTFTLTYTFLNTFTGCENFDTKLITVRPAPVVNAGNDRTECNNTNDVTLSGYSPLGGVWTGAGIIDANNGIFNSVIAGGVGQNNADTTYTLTYTYTDAIGCVNSDSMVFTIEFGDDVDAGPNFNVCENAGLQTLNGTPAGGTWSGTGIINPSGVFDPSVPTPGAFYTLSYTYGTGSCQKTDQLQVFVSSEIIVEAGPDTTVCLTNPSFNLTGNSPSGGGTWSGTGIVDAANGTFDPSVAGVGNHVITYDYTNATTGCQGSDTRTVSVVNAPIADAGGPVTFCSSNNNITLTDYVTPTPAGGTWSGVGIIDGINGVFNAVSAGGLGYNNADTTYRVVYNYSSGANCTDTDTLDITVIFGDVVSAGPDDTLCIDDGQLTLVGTPAGGTWSGSGIIDAFAGTFDPTVSGAGFITVTYTQGTGTCEKSDDKVIWVGALPTILPGPDESVCINNGAFTLSGFSPQGGVWSGTGITDGNAATFDPSVSGLGVFTLTYVYANPITGCDSSVTKTVTVNALPNVVATPTVEYCITTADVSLAGLAAPAGGTWAGTGVTDPNGIFNPTIAGGIGTYTLTYSYTDGNGCTNTDNMIVDVVAGDVVDAGPNDTLCIDDSQITLVGTPAGGTWSGTGITDANLGIFNPATAGTGIHTITYTFGAGTCERTDQLDIFVGALPTINPGANDVICVDNGVLTLSGYSPQGGVWSGTGITDGNAGTFAPSTSGVGTFTLTYVYANPITGCDSSVTKTVTVNPLPTVTTTPTVEYCNTTADISLAGLASPVGGTWSGTGVTDPNGIFNASVAGGIGTYILTYNYTDGNNCSNSSNMTVDIVVGDIVSAGNDDTLCIDDSQITLVGTPAGGTWAGNGIVDANLGIFDPATAGAGLHTLTYTYGTGTCEKSDDVDILVGALPTINPGADEQVCIDNGAFTLSGFSPQGGVWSGTGVTDGNAATFDPSVSGVGTFTLTYVYANPITGCDSSVTKQVTVSPLPTVVATDTVEFCNSVNDISLSGLASPAGGTWTGTGVVNANGLFNSNVAGGLGTYTLTYSFTDANGCTNTDNMIVNVIFGDTVEAGPDIAMCVTDGLINMTGFSPLGGTWSGNGIIDASNGTFDPTQVTAGFHTLTYTFGTGSCEKTDTRTIYVDTIPTVIAGPDITICQQADSITIGTGSPAGGTWSGIGVTSNGGFNPQNMSVGTFNLTYTYVNTTTGCSNTDVLAITVEAPPVVDAGPDETFCNTNQNITLSGQTPMGGLWSGAGIVDGINGIFNTQTAGGLGYNNADTTYTLTYSYTDPSGCFNTDTRVITVEFGDVIEAGLPDTICIDNGQFVLGGYSPVGGTWSGAGIVDANLGVFDPTVSGTGLHTLTYTIGSGTCLKSDTKTIFVDALPIISAGVDETICIDNGILTLSGYTPQGGTWSGTGITDANAGTFDPSISNLGTFTLTYTYSNPITGCTENDIKLITVAPLPNVSVSSPVEYCNTPNQITLTGYTPNSGGVWSGNGIVDAANGIFSTVIAGGLAHDGSDTSYFVTYTYTDGNSCTNSDILQINVTYGDSVLAGSNDALCIDDGLLTFSGFSPAGGTWSGTGVIDPAGVFDPQIAGVGTHTVTYTFGTGTCEKSETKTVIVGAPATISAGVDQTVCIDNGTFTLSGYSPLGGVWTGTGVDSSGNFDPSIGVGTYTLTYTFINSVTGCEAVDTKIITVAPLPTVTTLSTALYCNIAANITLTGYSPAGGTWTGAGIVDAANGIFNTTQAGGLAFDGGDTTYTLTYTFVDGNGCENSSTMDVTVTFGDTVVAGVDEATCIDAGLLNLTGFSPAGGTWSGSGIIDPIAGVFDPQVAGVGSHTLTYSFGTGTCEKSITKVVTVGGDPVVNAGIDLSVCIDVDTFQFNNFSPLGGTWSGVGITDATNGYFDPATAGTGSHIITYTFINSVTGCEASDTRVVTVNPLPVVITPDTVEYCDNGADIYLAGYSPIGGVWSGTGIVDDSAGIFNTTIAGGVGTYVLTYNYTDGNGCENSNTTVVNVIFGDTVEAGPDLAVCISDAPFSLTGFSPAGGTWSGDGIINANGVFDPQDAGTGLHTITYTFGSGTCQKTDTRTVFVGDIPVVTAGADQTVCEQDAAFTLTGFSPAGGTWSGVGITDATNGIFDPSVSSVGTFTLTYNYINTTTGCENSDTKVVTVLAPPIVDAGTPVEYCNTNTNIILTGYSPVGGIWSGPGIVDALNGVFNTSTAGGLSSDGSDTTYTLIYNYTNSIGCTNLDSVFVTVTFGDTVIAGTPDTICIDNGILTLSGYSPAGGTWSGTGIIDSTLGLFDPTVSGTGLHTLTYTFGVETCRKSDTKTVFVDALPVVEAGFNQTVCIDNGSFALSGFSPQGGTWTGVGVDGSGNFAPAVAGVGTWTLTYTYITPTTGCENTDTKTITVAPLPTVDAGNDVVHCNTPNQITLAPGSPVGGVWSGPGIVDASTGGFNTVVAGGLGYNGADTAYTLTYTYTDGNGCINSDSIIVDVIFGDTVEAGPNQSVCIDIGLMNLTGFSPAGGVWSGNGITNASGIFDPTAAGPGTHTLTYTFGTGSCQKTDTKTIFVGEPPVVNAGTDQTVCIDNGILTLSGFLPFGGFWIGTSVDSSGNFDPSIGVGSYTLTYTFINSVTGCEVSDTKVVTVAPLPTVTTTPTVTYCDIASNITLTGYTPAGGIWTGSGIVDGSLGLFNTTQAGGLAYDGGDTTYTLTYTYTDGNGCVNSNTMDVTVTYGDTVVAGPDEATCIDAGLLNLTGFSPAGGTWSGTGIIDPVAGVFDPQQAGGGTHIITYTYGNGTCEKSVSKTIVVGTDPIVEAGPDLTYCIDEASFQLTNYSPLGGTWSGVGITDAVNGFFDPATAGAGTWILTYSFTNSITGCEASDTRTVTINPLPVVTAPDSLEFCNTGTNITLSGYSPIGGTWIGSGIVDQNNGIFNTQIAGGLGVYPIEYRYTDVNGCQNNDTTIITVIFGDTVEAGPDLQVCISDAPFVLTGFQPVGATWTGPGITDPSGVFDPQAAGAGLHTIVVSFGSGTCLKTDTRDIFVGEIPTVLAGADDAVCGQDADYQLTGFSPPGGYWIGVGVDSSGLFSPVAATPGTWTLTYTYVNPITGCQNSDTKEVFVETPPAVDAGGTVTFCNSTDNITLNQQTPLGGVWSGAGIVDGLNGIFNTTAAGGLGYNGADTTYRVVYEFTSSTGCFGRDTLDIIVTFGDTVYAGVDDTLCLDGGQLTLIGSPAGGIWSGQGIIDSVSGTFDPVVAGTGLRTLTYTFGQETCEKSDVKTIFVGPLPVVDAGVDELICVDQPSFALSNFSPQGGYWIGVGVDSAGNFDPTTAGVGTWTLTYTFVNSITGCDNTDTKTITVAPLPTVTVPDSVEYCANPNDITLSGYSPTGGTWSGSGIVSGNAGIFSTVLAGGLGFNGADTTYPVIYTFTDGNGCTNRDTMNINVIFGDTVDAGPDISVCITDGLITLTGYTPPSGGTWSGTGIVDVNAGIFDPNLAGGGTHVITYTFGTGTCEKTDTRTIFVGTVPAVDAGPDVLVCADQTAFTLTSYSPIGGTWAGSGITDDTLGIFDPQVTGDGTFVLTYTYINDVTGCENFDTREITVAPLPIVNVDDSLEFCINNNNIPLTDYVNTTPSTGVTWSGAGIVDPTNGIFNATIAGGIGQYVINVGFTDGNGCSNDDSLLITVIFGDTVEAGPDDTLCINDNPILLTGFSPIGGTFSGAGVDAVSNTFDPGLAGAGLHIITYTFGTGTCEKTDTRTILVGDLPSINIGNDQTICIDAPAFTLTGYSPQGGTWSGVGITDPIAGVFNVDSAGVGTHILTYTFANSITGCENTAQRTITVAPLPVVEAGAPILICDNPDDYTIPTSSYSPNGGQWSGAGIVNSTAGVFNTVIAGGVGYNNADTTYPVIYTFTDGNGCTNFDTLDITVEFGDTIFAGPNEALCIDIGVIQLTGFLPTSNFTWSGPGIVNATTGQFDPQAAGPGAHTITISTGVATCAKTDDKIIFVGTPPAVNPGNDQAVCADDSAFTFTGFSPPGGVWSGTGITDSLAGTFDPQLTGTGTFVLTYTFVNSVTNCETAATKTVTVNPLPFVDAGDTVQYCDNPNDIVLSGYTPASGGFWSGPGVTNPSQGIFNTGQAGGIGVYHLDYNYTDPFTGCSNNDTLVVDVIFGDTVVAGPNDTLCIQDLPITLQGSPAGGFWTGTGITNGNLGIFNPAVAQGGTHVLTYTFGTGTCEKTDTKIIFVGEPDPLDAGNDQILCVDASAITLTASLPDGVWSGNGITDVNAGEFTPSVAQVGTHNIVYTYTNQVTGCVSMDTLVIEVRPLPVVNTAGAITYCEADLDVTLPTPNLTPGIWSGAGIIDQNNGIFNGVVAGGLGYNGLDTIYPITYTHTDAFGCSNSDILDVTITYGDTVVAGQDQTLCVDDAPITLVGTPVGGVFTGVGVTGNTFDPSVGVGGGVFDVIYTQGTGTCEKSDTMQITVIDVTGTDAGNDEDFCYEDGLVTLSGQSPLGGVWSGPGVQDGNLGTFLTQSVSTGINNDTVQVCYTYTDVASGCNYTDCKNVIIRPLPTPNFTAIDTACVNQVITFNNTSVDAIAFEWDFGDGNTSSFLSPTHSYDTSGLYTVTLIAFSDFNCPDTITQDILIYETPQAGFTMSTNDGCGPLTVAFTNVTSNPDQNITYIWDFGNGLTSTQANPPAQTYNAGVEDTTYVVWLTVQNLCGSSTFTDSITVRAQPVAIMAADDNFGCGPLTVNFSNGSTGGPNSYLWNFGPFGASTDTVPPPVTFTIPDTFPVTYTVTLTATNACGTDMDAVNITVIPGSVNAGIGTDVTSGCEPLTVNFTSAVQMGDNVEWIFGDGNTSVLNNPSHLFDTVGIFTVMQIVTNQCGSDTATIDIEVFPQPPMAISHAPFVCVGQPMQFYNNSTPIAGTLWEFGDGTTSSLTNPQHVYTTPGFYTVYVTNYSVTHLCPLLDSTIVEVKDIPNASFTVDAIDGCAPVTISVTNNSTGLFHSWMFIDGDNSDTTFSIATSPSHTFTDAGQHYIVLTTTDNFGCFEDTTITGIVVHPVPNATFEPDVEQQCGLDATVLLNNLTTDADAYFWDFGNGTFSNVTHPTISYNNVGTHTISLEASNTFGCKDTVVQDIEVYPSPFADYDLTPQYGCEPLTVQFQQLAINTNGYYWRFGDGDTSVQANPIHTFSAGKYDVTFIADIDGVCFDSIKLFNVVHAEGSPVADFEIIQSDPDNPTGIIEFVNNSIGATRYEWEFGDGTFSNEENPTKEYLENGQRIVRLIAWNEANCTDTLIKVIDPIEFKGLFVPNAFSPDAGIGDVRLFKPVGVNIETYRAQVFSQWGELLWESEALDDAGRPTEGWDGIYRGTPMPQGAYVWKVEAVFRDGSIWEGQKNTLGQTRKMGSVTLLR